MRKSMSKGTKMPKGMPPKSMPKKMDSGMHRMSGGHMMSDAEMKAMMGGGSAPKKRKGAKVKKGY